MNKEVDKKMNKKVRIYIGIIIAIVVVIAILSSVGLMVIRTPSPAQIPTSVVPAPTSTKEKGFQNEDRVNNITIEADGLIIHYQKQSFWNKREFSKIQENKVTFKINQIKQFTQSLNTYSRTAKAYNLEIEINESRKSTVLKCDIHDVISKTRNNYRAQFEWLLEPLGLDFIDDNFVKSETELSWSGLISGVPTDITLKFPASIEHCHAHVWWTVV